MATRKKINALEAAANAATENPDKEPARLACVQALHAASEEYDDAQIDLAEMCVKRFTGQGSRTTIRVGQVRVMPLM